MKDRNKILFGLVMLLMVVGIIGFSYALFTTKVEKKGALNIVAGELSCPIQSSDLANGQITLQANEEKEITVTLTNQSLIDIHSMITYSGSSNIEVLASSSNESAIEIQSLAKGTTLTYTLKLKNNGTSPEVVTLNERCGLSNKDLILNEGETKITGTYEKSAEYKDPSGANAPKLVEGMIPVVYDEEEQRWEKADTTKEWYDYTQQKWANAVTVVEKTTAVENGHDRTYYQQAEAGEPILMDDINTMWVWIPRYEYDYVSIASYAGGTAAKPGEIKIKFISKDVTSATEDNYKVHPAFTFGEDQLEGFWYGKFETSSKESCSAAAGSINTACDLDTFTPKIKPNVISWRGIRISTMFTLSRKMEKEYANEYGFNGNEIDTHMSKNSEWGAVAYLSQSTYGKYGKDGEEVYINNCSRYTTGIAGATASAGRDSTCKNTYETVAGQKASTTGNITGVYDMSGGAGEQLMGALDDGTGKPRSGMDTSSNSGFNGVLGKGGSVSNGRELPDPKYYDLYTSTNLNSNSASLSATACDGGVCYGHALSETLGWYSDGGSFIYGIRPWLDRGGNENNISDSGVFGLLDHMGSASTYYTFRLVLAPTGS